MIRILAPLALLSLLMPTRALASEGDASEAGSVLDGQGDTDVAAKGPRASRGGNHAGGKSRSDSRDRSTHTQRGSGKTGTSTSSGSGERADSHRTSDAKHSDRHDAGERRESSERHTNAERHANTHHSTGRHAEARHHASSRHVAHAHHATRAARRHSRGPTYARVWRPGHAHSWYRGVFVYGPTPVVARPGGGAREAPQPARTVAPKRAVNHEGDLSVGIRGGSYISGYKNGDSFGDAGLGIAARYRPVESVGLELAWTYHDQSWTKGSERIEQPLTASVQLFAFPWTKVNPYALAGLTVTQRNIEEHFDLGQTYTTNQTLWGPTGGVGIEFGLGKQASLNFDARWTGYVNKPVDDPSVAGAFQGNMGVNVYF